MLSLYVLLKPNGSFIFSAANVALLLISIQLGYILVSLVYIRFPFRSFSFKSVLENIIKEPNWSFHTSDQLGALELNQPSGGMTVDPNSAKNIHRCTIKKIKGKNAVDEEIVIV